MRVLLDVSALIAWLDPNHTFHDAVSDWMARHGADWATCAITQNGFVRITSQPAYPGAATVAEALEVLEEAVSVPGHEFWPCDLALTDRTALDRGRLLGPAQVTDVYLLALAVRRGGCFATLDRRVTAAAAPGAKNAQLVVIDGR
ncbi:MAG: PIN domain-containing protein [Propionibacteriaceae bacterium]|jgi:toxin-antitoxin system PIN domain toxin|nr:PIN domain-containing protein [Propionibacteriaceae bacterium]